MIFNSMKGKYIPWLATDYSWNKNNDILTITTRKNVQWSDGTIFSASDVLFTFNLMREYPAFDGRGIWSYLSNVKQIDDNNIEFKFSSVYVPGLDAIANQIIVPKHIWEKIEDPIKFTNPEPVGTGPFTEIVKFKKTGLGAW